MIVLVLRTQPGTRTPTRKEALRGCAGIDDKSNLNSKSQIERIALMLTRLIQRSQSVAENAFEYEYRSTEYEYRSAEYEYRGAEYE